MNIGDTRAQGGGAWLTPVSCDAQNEPKLLRQARALLPLRGADTWAHDLAPVPKNDRTDGAHLCLGQSAQRSNGSPARRINARADERRAACRDAQAVDVERLQAA